MGGLAIRNFAGANAAGDVYYNGGVPYDSRGALLVSNGDVVVTPWKLASWGDSRANFSSQASPDLAGASSLMSGVKASTWAAGARDDWELTHNFGVSGDVASGWDSTTRTGGKTIAALCASDADIVDMHVGVNDWDAWNGSSPAYADQVTTVANDIIAAIREMVKHGKRVMFHAVMPQTATGWGSNATEKQAGADESSELVRAEISTMLGMAVFVDSRGWAKDSSTGYASSSWYLDDTHVNLNGAYREGKDAGAASYDILPARNVARPRNSMVNWETIALATNADSGTITFGTVVRGTDSAKGQYVEYTATATALASGEAVANISALADVGSFAGTPAYEVQAGDWLQSKCRIVIDNGTDGGTPSIANPGVRQRLYYQAGGSSFADFGDISLASGYPAIYRDVDFTATTPRMATTTASPGIEASTISKGFTLVVRFAITATNTPVRVRIYNPLVYETGPVPGALNAGTSVREYKAGNQFSTVIDINTTLPAIAGGANLGVGKLLYTLPAGICIIDSASMSVGITQTQGNINADTPDVGVGTVIASGAVALLSGTATFENIITGQTAANCTGSKTVATTIPTAAVPLVINSGDAHTVHLNVADGWAASGDAAAILRGRVVLNWRHMQ
jgi:hypothetical protein